MTINLADNTPRVSYAVAQGATQTSFTVSFEFFDAADLNVYVDGTLKTITTDYTVSGGNGSTGTVTMSVTGATGGSTVVITRDIDLKRTTDFPASGSFQIGSLNTELDKLVAIAADLDDKASRALQLTDFDTAVSLVLPDVNTRKGKTLAFNASTGAVEAGPSTSDVQTVSATAADIATLADIEDGTDATDAIQNVAAVASDVSSVAAVASNVSTVAGISSNVTAVAGNASNINAVAADATDIGVVAGKATEIGRLGTADAVADMNTLGTAAIVADMDALADISSDITAVADIASDVSAVEDIAANVTTVAGVSANVTTVAGSIGNVNTAAGSIANINTTAGSIANVNTTAANITDVNTFAVRYRIGSSDPTSSLDAGDLFFNTTSNTLKVYNGSAWVSIDADTDVLVAVSSNDTTAGYLNGKLTAGTNVTLTEGSDGGNETLSIAAATELSGDTSPQLGGDLQSNGNDILFADSDKAIFGAGSDLQIYHDSSTSYIYEQGTGDLRIRGSQVRIEDDDGSTIALFKEDAGVELRYDGAVKLESTSYGIDISGAAVADTHNVSSASGAYVQNFDTYQNFKYEMSGNVTLNNPSTEKAGQSGHMIFIQDGTGSRTLSIGTDYETAGGAGITLSTAANATDIVPYVVLSTGRILLGTPQLAFS